MTKNNAARSLQTSWDSAAAPLRADRHAAALLDALCAGRFSFAREAWQTPDGPAAHELLLRAWNKDSSPVNRGAALPLLLGPNGLPALGPFLVAAALAKIPAQAGQVLSINILPSHAALPSFWNELPRALNGHRPQDIIFEILEHESVYAVDDALLRAARAQGYRFALDDFTGGDDTHRLRAFAPYLSFVKLDGSIVRAGMGGDPVLRETLAQLRRDYPDLKIVAEYVADDAEAKTLFAMGVTAVQGHRWMVRRPVNDCHRPY